MGFGDESLSQNETCPKSNQERAGLGWPLSAGLGLECVLLGAGGCSAWTFGENEKTEDSKAGPTCTTC